MFWLNMLQPFSWNVPIRELTGTHNLPPLCPCLLPVKNKILHVGREADEFALLFCCDTGMAHSQGKLLHLRFFQVRYILIWSWGCSFFSFWSSYSVSTEEDILGWYCIEKGEKDLNDEQVKRALDTASSFVKDSRNKDKADNYEFSCCLYPAHV